MLVCKSWYISSYYENVSKFIDCCKWVIICVVVTNVVLDLAFVVVKEIEQIKRRNITTIKIRTAITMSQQYGF